MTTVKRESLSLVLLAAAALSAACSSPSSPPDQAPEADLRPAVEPAHPEPPVGKPFAVVSTSEGDFTFELLPDLAPKTVENFIQLAKSGFYYRTTFHRVKPAMMVQAGDPNSKDNNPYNDGQGNSGVFLPAEFSQEPFQRGTVAMARQPHNVNSASSQFFVCLKRIPEWNGEYTVFGKVVEGIEVVEKISMSPLSKDPNLKERPTARKWIKKVTIEYRGG